MGSLVATDAQLSHQNSRGRMGLFDRTVDLLNEWLYRPAEPLTPENEQAHAALLEESSTRAASTLAAIREGNLVAASSTIEDERATTAARYAAAFANSKTSVGAVGLAASKHTDHITTSRATKGDDSPSIM